MGPGLLPFDWIFLMVGGSQTAPQKGHPTFRAAPGVGVCELFAITHLLFVICLTKGLVGVSQLQGEKLYGFSSHQSESSQEMYPPGGALLRFQCLFLSLRKRQSWKLQPTAPLSPLNSSFLGSAVVPPSNFILIPWELHQEQLLSP